MRLSPTTGLLLAGATLTALALAGCSTPAASADKGSTDTISIVASTNVWGDVAKQIAGDNATISSIIFDPSQDPHSYEANAQVQLSLSKADLVIENGGGYDDFVDTLLTSANNSKATVLNAVTISGFPKPVSGEINEHVWYDFPTVKRVAAKITASLSKLDSAKASEFSANERKFDAALAKLEASEAAIKASSAAGAGVAITEPVPLYLLQASGLVNKTPTDFSEAIEEGTDVAPAVLQDTLRLFSNHTVKLLAYNEQTSGPETERVLAAAKAAHVAVVPVTETLPRGKDYVAWMTGNVDAIGAALK
jgi:zinc/manganese transport system substrate-binding protein